MAGIPGSDSATRRKHAWLYHPDPFPANEFKEPFDPHTHMADVRSLVTSGIYLYGAGAKSVPSPGTPRGWLGPNTRGYNTSYEYLEATIIALLEERGHKAVVSHYIPFKAAAVRAAMVKYGKNGVIHKDGYGSYIKLSVVMTNADFPRHVGPYEVSDCGKCVACIKACPNQALDKPYLVDDQRCSIGSQWVSGRIFPPRDKRQRLRTNIYRCGICQQVCPFNSKLVPRESFPFSHEGEADWPSLVEILSCDAARLKEIVGDTVFAKAGPKRVRRNAAVACGNSGDRAAVPALAELLRHQDAGLRCLAVWSMGRLAGPAAEEELTRAKREEQDEEVLEEISLALDEMTVNRDSGSSD